MHRSAVRSLNLGILAHVDAGKTSLTERLLHTTGVIGDLGSVDDGSTVTDSLELERRRGITIKAAVAAFDLGDVSVNLIDTPGHSDFIAEVERALGVLDGAVLVVSAVEGVQPQTRVIMRVLQRSRIPTLLFVNKIDRRGAQYGTLLASIAELLTPDILPLGDVVEPGTASAEFVPFDARDDEYRATLLDRLTSLDDELLTAYVADEGRVTARRLRRAVAAQTRRARLYPVFFGSAITGAGVDELLREGLYGWQVLDAQVTLTSSGYWPRQSAMHATFNKSMSSTAGDFRNLTPLVLMDALCEAGTVVREPIHRFHAEVPADVFGTLLPVLTKLRAVPRESSVVGGAYRVEGDIPAGRVHDLEQQLPPLTRGAGVLEATFDHYQDVVGPPPERARTDLNPLDRKEYLLRLSRRVV